MPSRPEVDAEIKKFEELQNKFSNFGAADSEPRNSFYTIMERADEGKVVHFEEMDADWWELFEMKGNEKAAAALTAQAKIVYDAIMKGS